MADYVYVPEAVLTVGPTTSAAIALHLAQNDIISLSAANLEAAVTATPGVHDVRQVSYVGTPLHSRQIVSGTVNDGVQGDFWQVTRLYADTPLSEAEVTAQNTARLAGIQASRTRQEDTVISDAVNAVSDAVTKAALLLIIQRMGITT